MSDDREIHASSAGAAPGQDAFSRSGFGFHDIIFLIRRNAIYVAAIIVLGMALAFMVVARMDRIYTSSSVLVLDPGSTSFDTVTSRLRTVDPAVAQTEVEVLRSRRLAHEVAENMGLFDNPEFALKPKTPSELDRLISLLFYRTSPSDPDTLGDDRGNTGDADQADTPVTSQADLEAVAGEVNPGLSTSGPEAVSEDVAQGNPEWDVEAELVVDKLLTIYSVQSAGQSLAIEIKATHTDPYLAADIANTVAELYIAESLQNQKAGIENAIQFLSRRAENGRDRLSSLRTELATLIRLNALDDTDLTETMIAELRSQRAIAALRGNGSNNELEGQIERTTEALRQRTRAELERSELELALEIERQRFQSISERLSEYEAQRDSLTPPARMITFAQPADEPAAPRAGLALGTSFVVLVSFAFVFSLMRAGLDNRVWTMQMAAESAAVPGLGVIPKLQTRAALGRRKFWKYVKTQPFSQFADAVRAVAPGHAFWKGAQKSSVMMLASASQKDGKTTISAALAAFAAQDGLRVLVVDVDVDKCEASRLLGVQRSSFKLHDALENADSFMAGIQKSPMVDGLDVVNFHARSHFGRKLSFDLHEEEKINVRLRDKYDLIIFDLSGASAANASRFTSFVDRVILMAWWGRTKAQDLQDRSTILKKSGFNVEGCILNGVNLKKSAKLGFRNNTVVNMPKAPTPAFVRAASVAVSMLGACMALANPVFAEELAFPGAFGFGAQATGWRGGEVIYVTTLDDSGPGSLRECVQREDPRLCLFSVSGTIELDSELKVGPNVYIAGQTAPGDGIQLRLREGFRSPVLLKDTQDVVLRFLKIRPGPGHRPTPSVDGITLENVSRIYVDHLSLMFATDELLNVHVSGGVSTDVTIANSILAFGLEDANHPRGRHSKGALICSFEKEENQCGRITLARNIFANNRDRNPDLKATELGPIELINNTFYNFGSQNGEFYDYLRELTVNYIGNLSIAGSDTRQPPPAMIQTFTLEGERNIAIFAKDNRAWACGDGGTPALSDAATEPLLLDAPTAEIASPIMSSAVAFDYVLRHAGDHIPGARPRDALDALVVSQVQNCNGHIIDSVEDVGGWPNIEAITNVDDDRDGDGMPDPWEAARPWLDPDDPKDAWADMPGTGYSNIEAYLASRAGDW